jgi:ligand-binding sensor domain-containing protein
MRNLIMCVVFLTAAVLASSALAVDPNLVAWYKFDEGSGTTALDSANGHNGTVNGATWTAGKVGGALSFDGVNDYVDVPDNPALRFTQNSSFTLCAWVNPISPSQMGTARF